MATAKLWWNGSSWVGTNTNCFTKKGGTNSSYANTNVTVNACAYDDFTVKLVLTCKASYDARPSIGAICWGTISAKSGSTTIVTQTWTESQAALTRSVSANNVNGYARPITCSFNVNAQSSDGYGGSQNSSYSLNYTSPFFTISYNANGGSNAPASQTALRGIATGLSNSVPTRNGYTFLGWDTNQAATTATYNPGSSISVTADTTLYAIWKAELTTISASDGTIGSTVPITLTQQGAGPYSYKHTVKYTINGTTRVIVTDVQSANQSWTYNWTPIATGTYGIVKLYTDRSVYPCTLTCETYSGDTLLGSKTVNINLTVPNTYAPSFTSKSISRTGGTYPTGFTGWVSGKTTPVFSAVVAPQENATIVSWKYTVNNANTTVTDSSTTKTWTGPAVTDGTLAMEVTDSRGLSVTYTESVTVSSYSAPAVTNPVLTRALSDGTIDGQGTYLKVTASVVITALSDTNTKSYSVEYREEGSSTWIVDGTGTLSSYSGTFTYLSSSAILNQSKTYEVRLVISDFYETTIVLQTVSTAAAIIDFKANGLGVAFGKVHEAADKTVEIAGDWTLQIGNTTLTEAQLIQLLNMI